MKLWKNAGLSTEPPSGFDVTLAQAAVVIREGECFERINTRNHEFIARWDAIVEEFGGRGALIRALEFCDKPEARLMLESLQHVEFFSEPMGFIAKGCHVNEQTFRRMIADGLQWRNRYEAARATAPKIHGVVDGLADDATPQMKRCSACKGKGTEDGGEDCEKCEGTGKIRVAAPVKKQELFLKQAGLIQEGGGVSVNVSQTVQQNLATLPSLEDVVRGPESNVISIERTE